MQKPSTDLQNAFGKSVEGSLRYFMAIILLHAIYG